VTSGLARHGEEPRHAGIDRLVDRMADAARSRSNDSRGEIVERGLEPVMDLDVRDVEPTGLDAR